MAVTAAAAILFIAVACHRSAVLNAFGGSSGVHTSNTKLYDIHNNATAVLSRLFSRVGAGAVRATIH